MVKRQLVQKLQDGRNLLLQSLGTRKLKVFPLGANIEEVDETGDLIYIEYGDKEFTVKVGEVIKFNKDKYKVSLINKIETANKGGYEIVIHTLSKSSQFIMPFLGKTRAFYRWDLNFCNCFIGMEKEGDYGTSIYLLYRWDGSKPFIDFENELSIHPWFIGTIETDDSHMMYEFCIPEGNIDIEKLIRGEYSQIDISSKQRILDFHGCNKNQDNTLYGTLFKTEKLIQEKAVEYNVPIETFDETELLAIMKEEDEIYLEKFRINIKENEKNKETLW